MNKNNIEKSLIKVNKNSIFFKIKNLFNRIFGLKKYKDNIVEENGYKLKQDIKKNNLGNILRI